MVLQRRVGRQKYNINNCNVKGEKESKHKYIVTGTNAQQDNDLKLQQGYINNHFQALRKKY